MSQKEFLKNYYQEYLNQETHAGAVQKGKADLVKRFTPSKPIFSFEWIVPVGIFAFICLHIFWGVRPVRSLKTNLNSAIEEAAFSGSVNDEPSVKVRKVSSRVGPTMVYQKNFDHTPVTIVWVFAGHQL